MKRSIIVPFVSFFVVFFLMCDEGTSPIEQNTPQFVIQTAVPDSTNKDCWLNVKDIINGDEKCVYTVQEIEHTYYLPIHSRPPSFNNKVVEGVFVEDSVGGMSARDTIFKVTKIIRDTTTGFPR